MNGWVTKKLGEVCEDSIRRLKDIDDTKFLYVDIAAIDRERKIIVGATEHDRQTAPGRAQQVVEVGDVLVSTVRPNLNAVAIVEQQPGIRRIASTGFCVLRARECVLPRYIYYFTQVDKVIAKLVAVSEKAAYPSVTDKIVKDVSIPIPPLAEQKRIVAKIDAAFEKIDKLKANAEKNLANAKELFQSALDEAMRPKKGWTEKRLGEVYNFIDYRGKTPTKIDKGIPLVTARNIRMGYLDYSVRDFISPDEYKTRQSRGIAHKGDILFTTEAPLGFVALADLDEFSTGQRVITFQQYEGSPLQLSNEFYYYYLQSKRFQNEIRKQATGATAQGIKASRLKNIPIAVVPFTEQKQIASRLNSLFEKSKSLEQNYARQIADCAEMRQAILREAFEGRM